MLIAKAPDSLSALNSGADCECACERVRVNIWPSRSCIRSECGKRCKTHYISSSHTNACMRTLLPQSEMPTILVCQTGGFVVMSTL
jgi:hypothetical protein